MRMTWCSGVVAIVLGVFVVTTAHAGTEYINTNRKLDFVKLVELTKKDQTDIHPQHPATVSIDKMRELLASLQISHTAFFKRTKITDRQVFDDYGVNYLAPYLAEALTRANNNQVVVFSYQHGNPKKIIDNDRFSTGKVWMEGTQLHIEFLKLMAKFTGDLSKRGYAEKVLGNAKGLRVALEAGPGQMLGASNASEIIFDTKATFAASGNQKHRMPESVSERLDELKKLYDRKMISDTEYRAKRQTIINGL